MGLKRVVFGRMLHHIAGGRKGRRRLAVQAAEPRRRVRSEVDVRHKCRGIEKGSVWADVTSHCRRQERAKACLLYTSDAADE